MSTAIVQYLITGYHLCLWVSTAHKWQNAEGTLSPIYMTLTVEQDIKKLNFDP